MTITIELGSQSAAILAIEVYLELHLGQIIDDTTELTIPELITNTKMQRYWIEKKFPPNVRGDLSLSLSSPKAQKP